MTTRAETAGRQAAARRREGTWIHYVYLRPHNNPAGRPCPGATATIDSPPIPPRPNERTKP